MGKIFMSVQPDGAGGWMWMGLHEDGIGSACQRGFYDAEEAEEAGRSQKFRKGTEQVWN